MVVSVEQLVHTLVTNSSQALTSSSGWGRTNDFGSLPAATNNSGSLSAAQTQPKITKNLHDSGSGSTMIPNLTIGFSPKMATISYLGSLNPHISQGPSRYATDVGHCIKHKFGNMPFVYIRNCSTHARPIRAVFYLFCVLLSFVSCLKREVVFITALYCV